MFCFGGFFNREGYAMRGATSIKIENKIMTGNKNQVLEALTRAIAAYIRQDRNVKLFYIGIASGSNLTDALRRRYDRYKRDCGFNHIVGLYQSSSLDNTRFVERELDDNFCDDRRCANRTGGGAGREGAGPKFFVYLALRRWG